MKPSPAGPSGSEPGTSPQDTGQQEDEEMPFMVDFF